MTTPLIPQEIFLLERYSSLDYFGQMRDAWAEMIKTAEQELQQFMTRLPPDYRTRHLSLQPDIVWGERVLPNIRSTLQALNIGYTRISHGDLDALGFAGNVLSDDKGMSDFSEDWMPKQTQEKFWFWKGETGTRASNISATQQAGWNPGSLSTRYSEESRGALNPPATWPQYRANASVTVKTGQPVPRTGIYLPACPDSCAALLIKDYECFPATVGYNPKTMQNVSESSTTWTLVERIADSGGGTPGATDPIAAGIRLRAAAGETCPREGFWLTPAKTDSRRHFKAGEVMPSVGGDYGATIWQWDEQQS
jgi:hypothetical protein